MNESSKAIHQLIDQDYCEEEESIRVGMLLAFGIGILNATTYVSRGHVFASSQSGNLLYLGLDLANGDFSQVVKYLFPPIMFAIGIIIAEHFHDRPNYKHWRRIPFAIEIVVIAAATFLPLSWNTLANPIFGLACGLQSITFRRIRNTPVATVVITGSFQSAVESLTRYLHLKDQDDIFKTFLYLTIVLSYFAGIVGGAMLTKIMHQYTSLIAAGTLAIWPFIMTVPGHGPVCSVPETDSVDRPKEETGTKSLTDNGNTQEKQSSQKTEEKESPADTAEHTSSSLR